MEKQKKFSELSPLEVFGEVGLVAKTGLSAAVKGGLRSQDLVTELTDTLDEAKKLLREGTSYGNVILKLLKMEAILGKLAKSITCSTIVPLQSELVIGKIARDILTLDTQDERRDIITITVEE